MMNDNQIQIDKRPKCEFCDEPALILIHHKLVCGIHAIKIQEKVKEYINTDFYVKG